MLQRQRGGDCLNEGRCVCGARLLNPLQTMTPGLIGACLGNNYAGHAGVRRQVFCEWSTHTRIEELLSGGSPSSLWQGEASPQHTLPHNGLITHMYCKELNSIGLKSGPVHLISQKKKRVCSILLGVTITEAYQSPKNSLFIVLSQRE